MVYLRLLLIDLIIQYFNQYFIHTGKFDKEIYSIITSAYKIREKSDYDDFYIAPKEDAEEQLKNAELFISKVESFLTEYFK